MSIRAAMMDLTHTSKDNIVAEIRRRMDQFEVDLAPKACLFWAKHTVDVLNEHGFRALLQAGSASFRLLSDHLDDGRHETSTHFTYQFHEHEARAHLFAGRFPEIHCWAALPDYPSRENPTIVDVTTRYLIRNAADAGFEWRHTQPPDYLWCTASEVPPGEFCFEADIRAIKHAFAAIRRIPADTWDQSNIIACNSARVM